MTELIGPAASKKPTKSSQRGFGFKTALWIGGLLTIVTCIVLWAEVSKGSKVDHQSVAAEGVAPRTVPIAKAGRETLTKDVLLYGEFKPYQEILVHAKVSGYVRSIGVDIGDHVQAAQPLAKLEIPELNDDLNRASAVLAKSQEEVKRSEANYRDAHLAYQRLLEVAKSYPTMVAQQELDAAKDKDAEMEGTLGSARENVHESQAELGRIQTLVDYATISAPFSGLITKRFADVGALIQAGTASDTQAMPLVELAEDSLLRLDFPVPESAVPEIRVGGPVEVTVDALHESFPGKISRYSGRVDVSTRKMETEVEVPNPNGRLTPGMYATVRLVLEQSKNALTVPLEAVTLGQKPTVVVLNGKHRLEKRDVTLGLQTPDKVEIRSGLADNHLVLVGDRAGIQLGQKVTGKLIDIPTFD
ncbi:MAG TPA: efflux RND transporter periplasmic adaptor subunit [Chthoniobacterales bacterium]|nr:efflux RND transporter periplasmic adaptor subunit [Chthoniobacterales bacterium]